ncbi:unnamed protein product [Ectocarpus sp. 12 AP-2014]
MAQADRKALIALYNAIGGAKWKQKKNWNTGAALSRWEGVNITAKGRVLGLYLVNNNLQGPIPKVLGNLSKLQTLWLSKNHLSGQIPEELGALRKLESLWVEDNDLTGEIPASLGQLAKRSAWTRASSTVTVSDGVGVYTSHQVASIPCAHWWDSS